MILNDTWEWDGTTWSQRSPAMSPPARDFHALAYDAAQGTVVLFGGRGALTDLNDTWEWDGTTWSQRSPAISPPPRWAHALAYDASREKVVLFGGNNDPELNDTWEWDGTTWTKLSPSTSPVARYVHALAYDELRMKVVLFGGFGGSPGLGNRLNDTWEWDGTTWSERSPVASPTARDAHALAYDAGRGKVLLFGGYATSAAILLNDTWEWDGTTWSEQSPTASPPPIAGHRLAYDADRAMVLLFGGADAGDVLLGDTWTYQCDAEAP